jgi:hypothetical protein
MRIVNHASMTTRCSFPMMSSGVFMILVALLLSSACLIRGQPVEEISPEYNATEDVPDNIPERGDSGT